MLISLVLLLAVALLLESTVTTLPLVLVLLLCFATIKRDTSIFIIAFCVGIFFDIVTLRPVGVASMFFLTFLFLVFLYQRKYEIESYPFVIMASFVGSWFFLTIFGYQDVFFVAGVSALLAAGLFGLLQWITGSLLRKRTTPIVPIKKGFHFKKNV